MNKHGTALITGASSGIGQAFARELASRNYDLIITARRKHRLEELARELKSNYPISVDVIAADLSTEKDIKQVEEHIKKIKNLDMLVNNAGFGTSGYFYDVSPEKSINMINVHVLAATRFCRATLPGMIKRNKGSIINVSSLASFYPLKGNTIYNATKNYLNMFSRSIQKELKGYNIKVQALCPVSCGRAVWLAPEVPGALPAFSLLGRLSHRSGSAVSVFHLPSSKHQPHLAI